LYFVDLCGKRSTILIAVNFTEGAAMATRTDRKLAAILAADVVGYSRLVGNDEAGTIARVKALRKECLEPLVAEYHGRVVKLMGDGALVEREAGEHWGVHRQRRMNLLSAPVH
jgi:class 3 adenylate cyclase